jgi:outer membrane protein TolC
VSIFPVKKWFFLILLLFPIVCQANASNHLTLSLEEAIMLAVRENPSVQQAQLNHVLQKFALHIQQWQFKPHYTFQANTTVARNVIAGMAGTSTTKNIQPAASLLTPIGTQISLTSSNNIASHFNPGLSLQVIQPLMRGFGKPIVEATLYNAIDSELISRLHVESALRTTVTDVITAYLNAVSAENTVEIDQQALQRAQVSEQQTALYIKAGHKAGNEIITVKATVATAETNLENDKNNLLQARYALLTAIGIDPNTDVSFTSIDVPQLIKKYHVPVLSDAKTMVISNDIQYQTDKLTLEGATKRSLAIAEDNTRWQLNLTVNAATGNGNGGGQNQGFGSLVNGANQMQSAQLNLTIPIDDQAAKQAVVSAKIALREAAIALRQEKWNKETSAINGWNSIFSAERALVFAESAKKWQEKTYHISFQKFRYGLIDGLELQSAELQLITAEQALVLARINYLKALVNLDLLIGTTLKTWKVEVQYG